jgi:integrase
MRRRTKGAGSLRLRGRTWWITYYVGGRPIPESSGSTDKAKAENLLKQRIGEIATGRDVSPDRATINDLCALVITDYTVRKLRDAAIVKWRYEANIKPAIGNLLAARFGASQVRAFVSARREAGASDPTINRELSIIRRGFRLGFEEDPPMVRRVPHILKLDEDNARQGFLTPAQYETLLASLPERLKALFAVAYHVGTRKGELRKIKWSQVDFDAQCIRLQASQTKGKKARELPFYGEMEHWLRRQRERCPEGCQWVFFHNSRPVGAQLRGWREACEAAGVPALLFHDLRRTAVRNMRLAGIDQSVRMKISGHKTTSMEARYNILDDADLKDAATKMNSFLKAQKSAKLKRVK